MTVCLSRALAPGRHSTPRSLFVPLSVLVALACVGINAAAQSSPYYIGASQAFSHESNLLRLSTQQTAPAGYDQADTVSSTSLLAGFDQSFGRQRAYGNLAVRANRYGNNGLFNNTGYSLGTGLNWQTVERLSGTLAASANRTLQLLNTQELGFPTRKNLESVESLNATASLGVVTQYSFEVNAGYRNAQNSLQEPTVQARDFSQKNASVGVRWRPRAAASLGLSVGTTQGRYPKFRQTPAGNFEADRFKRNDVEISATLAPSESCTAT